jgi:hypothetical protein
MVGDPKREKQQARWRRNKADARARAKAVSIPLAPEFVARVMEERDRRSDRRAYRWASDHPKLDYWTNGARQFWVNGHGWGIRTWFAFVADVWAATILLEAEHGPGMATPTRIARRLSESGREHGYSPNSVRVMVYRARPFIAALEVAGAEDPDASCWQPFPASA